MPESNTKETASKSSQEIKLADVTTILPEHLSPLLLVDADFYQYGQLLIIKLADGSILVVEDYFANAPDLGLPLTLVQASGDISIISMTSDDFTSYLNTLGQTHPEIAQAAQQQIASAGEWDAILALGKDDGGNDKTTDNKDNNEPVTDETIEQEIIDLAALELVEVVPETNPNALDSVLATTSGDLAASGEGDNGAAGPTAPSASDLSSLSGLNLGGLGGGGSSLGSLGGASGSMIGTASVDGLNGVGGTSAIGGSLGSTQGMSGIGGSLNGANPNAFTPPADAFIGNAAAPAGLVPIIRFEGTYNTNVEDLNYKFAASGFSQIDFFSTEDGGDGTVREDFIQLSDNADWSANYAPNAGFRVASDKAGLGTYSAASSVILEADLLSNNTLSVTITGVGTVNINISGAASGEAVENLINANATLSSAGVIGYWNTDENANIGFNSLVIADPSNRAITAASLDTSGNLTINNAINVGNVGHITYDVTGYVQKYPGESGAYTPDARHGSDIPVIQQTNIYRYNIITESNVDDHVAVGGANNPNFLSLDTGTNDYDTLSFYFDDPAQPGDDLPITPQSADPRYVGNGDYDLATSNAYTKITNVNFLEARDYGTNFINLNQVAVRGITEEMIEAIDNMDGTFDINTNTNIWILDIAGDAADIAALTDESTWSYNGIIDEAAYVANEYGGVGVGVSPTDTKNIASTRDQFGNIQYQFTATNGGETYYVNISADILDHPDWYYTGTAGDDAYELPDTQFGSVDFGAGEDTLELNSGLVSKAQSFIGEGGDLANVEIINLTNTQSGSMTATTDTATVDRTFVTNATDTDNDLSIIGDSVDSVVISDVATDWTFLGTAAGTGGLAAFTFNQYAYRPGEMTAVTLNIESELAGSIADYYRGWEGDDILTVFDFGFAGIDGGAGTDAIRVNAAAQDYTVAPTIVDGIEVIDGAGHAGATTITVNEAFVDNNGGVVSIIGDSGTDSAAISDTTNWSYDGEVSVFGVTALQYSSVDGSATLNIQKDFASTPGIFFNGGTGDDTFTAPDINFISLDGGAGTDWLEITSDDYDFTAMGVAARVDNLEVIDARGHSGASTVTLNLASVVAMTDADNKIHVLGDAADTVVISDLTTNWSYIAHVDGVDDFVGMRFHQYQSLDGTRVINIFDGILNQPDVRAIGDIGGASSDIIVLDDLGFSLVDGLTGTDTLRVNQAGALDFTGLGGNVNNLEALDLTGVATSAILSADFVRDATDANNKLVLQGDNADTLSFSDPGNWNYLGVIDASGPWSDLHVYQGTASGSETVFLYQETNLGNVAVDATGTAVNDLFRFADKDDANLDGGAGTDTLTFQPTMTTRTVDFSTGTTVSGIEILDLRNSSSEDVTFDLGTVGRADNNAMFVLGDAGMDSIDVSNRGQWSLTGRAQFSDAPDMFAYVGNSGQTLYVQNDLAQDLFQLNAATSGDDIFRVLDTNFGALNGGGGNFDRLHILQEGAFDLSNLGGSSLTSVEVIDSSNGVVNNLSLSAASIQNAATFNQFYVLGETGDTLALNAADGWQAQDTIGVSADLTLNSYTSAAAGGQTVYVDSQVATSIA